MIEEELINNQSPQTEDIKITDEGPSFTPAPNKSDKKLKKKKSKARSIIEWTLTGIFAALFVVFGAGQIDGMIHRNEHMGEMIRFGTSSYVVWTDSMEPIYPVKSAIINYLDDEATIVNKFNASKSELYMLDDEKPYFDGANWLTYDLDTDIPSEDNKFIYYNNDISHWNNPHLVAYSLTDSTVWPGIEMQKIDESIYRLEIKKSFDRVIFTNGDYVDITFINNEYYHNNVFKDNNYPLNPLFRNNETVVPSSLGVKPIMTHRVNEIKNVDGVNYFITAGINPDKEDSAQSFNDKTQYQISTYNKILGVVKINSRFVGGFFYVISSAWGLLIFLLIPALYLAITSVIDILRALKDNEVEESNTSKEVNSLKELSKEDKERLKKEMLEEMLNNKKGDK